MKLERPNKNVKAFASLSEDGKRDVYKTGTTSDSLEDNLNSTFERGFGLYAAGERPRIADYNGVFFSLSKMYEYLYQAGLAEWSEQQEYHLNSLTNKNGVIYRSKADNNIGNEPIDVTKLEEKPELLEFVKVGDRGTVEPDSENDDSFCRLSTNYFIQINRTNQRAHIHKITESGTHERVTGANGVGLPVGTYTGGPFVVIPSIYDYVFYILTDVSIYRYKVNPVVGTIERTSQSPSEGVSESFNLLSGATSIQAAAFKGPVLEDAYPDKTEFILVFTNDDSFALRVPEENKTEIFLFRQNVLLDGNNSIPYGFSAEIQPIGDGDVMFFDQLDNRISIIRFDSLDAVNWKTMTSLDFSIVPDNLFGTFFAGDMTNAVGYNSTGYYTINKVTEDEYEFIDGTWENHTNTVPILLRKNRLITIGDDALISEYNTVDINNTNTGTESSGFIYEDGSSFTGNNSYSNSSIAYVHQYIKSGTALISITQSGGLYVSKDDGVTDTEINIGTGYVSVASDFANYIVVAGGDLNGAKLKVFDYNTLTEVRDESTTSRGRYTWVEHVAGNEYILMGSDTSVYTTNDVFSTDTFQRRITTAILFAATYKTASGYVIYDSNAGRRDVYSCSNLLSGSINLILDNPDSSYRDIFVLTNPELNEAYIIQNDSYAGTRIAKSSNDGGLTFNDVNTNLDINLSLFDAILTESGTILAYDYVSGRTAQSYDGMVNFSQIYIPVAVENTGGWLVENNAKEVIVFFEGQATRYKYVLEEGSVVVPDPEPEDDLFWEALQSDSMGFNPFGTNLQADNLSDAIEEVVSRVKYPVGAIFKSTVFVDPAVKFGFGTWEAIEGRMLLSTDNLGVGSEGGSKTHTTAGHTLTIDEIPNHRHPVPLEYQGNNKASEGTAYAAQREINQGDYEGTDTRTTEVTGDYNAHSHEITTLPPYRTIYMWRRTA